MIRYLHLFFTLVFIGSFSAQAVETTNARRNAATIATGGVIGVAAGFILMNLQSKPQENSGLIWTGALLGTLGGVGVVASRTNSPRTNEFAIMIPIYQSDF